MCHIQSLYARREFGPESTHLNNRNPEQVCNFSQFAALMSKTDRTVMCRSISIPRLNETLRANRKSIVAVCISYAQNLAWD
jgi:hypothetical protein